MGARVLRARAGRADDLHGRLTVVSAELDDAAVAGRASPEESADYARGCAASDRDERLESEGEELPRRLREQLVGLLDLSRARAMKAEPEPHLATHRHDRRLQPAHRIVLGSRDEPGEARAVACDELRSHDEEPVARIGLREVGTRPDGLLVLSFLSLLVERELPDRVLLEVRGDEVDDLLADRRRRRLLRRSGSRRSLTISPKTSSLTHRCRRKTAMFSSTTLRPHAGHERA